MASVPADGVSPGSAQGTAPRPDAPSMRLGLQSLGGRSAIVGRRLGVVARRVGTFGRMIGVSGGDASLDLARHGAGAGGRATARGRLAAAATARRSVRRAGQCRSGDGGDRGDVPPARRGDGAARGPARPAELGAAWCRHRLGPDDRADLAGPPTAAGRGTGPPQREPRHGSDALVADAATTAGRCGAGRCGTSPRGIRRVGGIRKFERGCRGARPTGSSWFIDGPRRSERGGPRRRRVRAGGHGGRQGRSVRRGDGQVGRRIADAVVGAQRPFSAG